MPDDAESRLKLAEWVPRPCSGWPRWQFEGGYISRKFVTNADLVTDPDDETVELDQAHVLIYDKKLIGLPQILWLLESVIQSRRPLLIIAEDVGGEALASLVINHQRGGLKVGLARAPGVGDRREVMLRDIANLTGGKVISEDLGIGLENTTLDMLGRAERVVIGKDKTTIIGGCAKQIRKAVVRRLWPENTPRDDGTVAAEIPGATQPALADWMAPRDLPLDGWQNLWQLTKTLAPKTCRIVTWSVGTDAVPPEVLERAEAHLIATDPSIVSAVREIKAKLRPGDREDRAITAVWTMNPSVLTLLHQEVAQLKERRRSHGIHLLRSVIPNGLRRRLTRTDVAFPNGRYEVTARAADGRDVTLTPRDLVGLDLDFSTNTLSGDGAVYGVVRVRPRVSPLPLSDLEMRLGWISLTRALELVGSPTGGGSAAWNAIRGAIQCGRLRARGLADGVTKDIAPEWLDFLAWQEPGLQQDVLWFQRDLARRKGVVVPDRVENVLVEVARIAQLWTLPVAAASATIELAAKAALDPVAISPAPANAKPPFDRKQAMALLIAKKLSGVWKYPPAEEVTADFLRGTFRGIPNGPHRAVRREVWGDLIRPGPKPRSARRNTAAQSGRKQPV